jgi:hypothetical protein
MLYRRHVMLYRRNVMLYRRNVMLYRSATYRQEHSSEAYEVHGTCHCGDGDGAKTTSSKVPSAHGPVLSQETVGNQTSFQYVTGVDPTWV